MLPDDTPPNADAVESARDETTDDAFDPRTGAIVSRAAGDVARGLAERQARAASVRAAAQSGPPRSTETLSLSVPSDVVAWFRAEGDAERLMIDVLTRHVWEQRRAGVTRAGVTAADFRTDD